MLFLSRIGFAALVCGYVAHTFCSDGFAQHLKSIGGREFSGSVRSSSNVDCALGMRAFESGSLAVRKVSEHFLQTFHIVEIVLQVVLFLAEGVAALLYSTRHTRHS